MYSEVIMVHVLNKHENDISDDRFEFRSLMANADFKLKFKAIEKKVDRLAGPQSEFAQLNE